MVFPLNFYFSPRWGGLRTEASRNRACLRSNEHHGRKPTNGKLKAIGNVTSFTALRDFLSYGRLRNRPTSYIVRMQALTRRNNTVTRRNEAKLFWKGEWRNPATIFHEIRLTAERIVPGRSFSSDLIPDYSVINPVFYGFLLICV